MKGVEGKDLTSPFDAGSLLSVLHISPEQNMRHER